MTHQEYESIISTIIHRTAEIKLEQKENYQNIQSLLMLLLGAQIGSMFVLIIAIAVFR